MFFFVGILLLIIISTTVRIRIPAENKIMILCGVGIWITVCIIQYLCQISCLRDWEFP